MNIMNPGVMIGMLAAAAIITSALNSAVVSRKSERDNTPYYTTDPNKKFLNNKAGEKINEEFALLPDFKKKKVEEITINYMTAKYQNPFQAEFEWQERGIGELYTKFGSFDAIIEHFQPSDKR